MVVDVPSSVVDFSVEEGGVDMPVFWFVFWHSSLWPLKVPLSFSDDLLFRFLLEDNGLSLLLSLSLSRFWFECRDRDVETEVVVSSSVFGDVALLLVVRRFSNFEMRRDDFSLSFSSLATASLVATCTAS